MIYYSAYDVPKYIREEVRAIIEKMNNYAISEESTNLSN